MNWAITLGSIGGIRVRVHVTFLVFLAWIGISFWNAGGAAGAEAGLAYILLLFACVVAHEFGHITAAARYGGETEDIVLLPIGGVARMRKIPQGPGQELVVALAGPAVNLAIAAVLVLLGARPSLAGIGIEGGVGPGFGRVLAGELALANLVLAAFNLLPAFPMDGGRALRSLLALKLGRVRATDLASRIGQSLAVGIGISGFLAGYPLLMLVAVFIWFGAGAENREAQLHAFAHKLTVADAALTRIAALGAGATLADAVALIQHSPQADIPVIDDADRPLGLILRRDLLAALHQHGGALAAVDAMRGDIPRMALATDLDDALRAMQESGLPAVLAVDAQGRLAGLVTLENLGQMLMFSRLGRQGA